MVQKSKRGVKDKAGGKWTTAKYWGHLRGVLRQGFMFYPAKAEAKRRAAVREGRYTKYRCADCEGLFGTKEVHVDHIVPCGTLTDYSHLAGFVERLYCEPEDLQILCKECHATKTKVDNKQTRSKKQ